MWSVLEVTQRVPPTCIINTNYLFSPVQNELFADQAGKDHVDGFPVVFGLPQRVGWFVLGHFHHHKHHRRDGQAMLLIFSKFPNVTDVIEQSQSKIYKNLQKSNRMRKTEKRITWHKAWRCEIFVRSASVKFTWSTTCEGLEIVVFKSPVST